MPTNLVLCYPVQPHHIEQIQATAPDYHIINAGQEGIAEALFEADLFCGHAKVPVDWPGVVKQGRLEWIQSSAAGMDHCLVPSVIDSDIIVTSASAVLADQVAEHMLGLILAWMRSLPVFFEATQKREFIRRPTRDLHRATVGIVGFGGVGRRLAAVLAPFQVRILAVDMFPVEKPDHVETLVSHDRIDEILPECDVVILALPLNESTRGMFDARRLDLMKPDALLVNGARGPLIVTEDLVASLRADRLAGAVMDVTDPEPLPEDHELWTFPQVIITPHVAGQSRWRIDNMTRMFCRNLKRWREKEPLINYLEDKSLGFPKRDGSCLLWEKVG